MNTNKIAIKELFSYPHHSFQFLLAANRKVIKNIAKVSGRDPDNPEENKKILVSMQQFL